MKIIVINGPNINMLGIREKEVYGDKTYDDLKSFIKNIADENNIDIDVFQSNHEGIIVDKIQEAYFKEYDAIIINPAAYTHTSVAILDALKAVNLKSIEVHLSDLNSREDFRKKSFISEACEKTIIGKGFEGYKEAILYLLGQKFS